MGEEGGGGSDDFDPHGDPKTDPRERRRIRYEYRELIAETQSKEKKIAHCGVFGFPFQKRKLRSTSNTRSTVVAAHLSGLVMTHG